MEAIKAGLGGFSRAMVISALMGAAAMPLARAQDAELTVFDWSGYEDPALNPAYVKKYGQSPTFSFFADEDEAFEKLRSGYKADLAHPCSTNILKWRDGGLLQPLDTSRIAGWKDIMPALTSLKDVVTDKDGVAWFMPFDWGNTLTVYRTDKIKPEQIASLKSFADPQFKDRVSMPGNADAAYALGLLATGARDMQKVDDQQFKAASDFLREVHKNVRLYWTDNTELGQALGGGEVDLAWAWTDTATLLKANGVPVETMRDTTEGYASWNCGYVLLKGAPGNLDKAYEFLSSRLAPEVSNYMVTAWGYGHANEAGMKAIDPSALAKAGYSDLDKMAEKTVFAAPLPPGTKQRFVDEFEKIKAGY